MLQNIVRIVLKKIKKNFGQKTHLLNDSEFGFRHNRSTSFALIILNEDITSLLDRQMTTIIMFIDLRKAFDAIDHNILIKKAENMGLRGIVIN